QRLPAGGGRWRAVRALPGDLRAAGRGCAGDPGAAPGLRGARRQQPPARPRGADARRARDRGSAAPGGQRPTDRLPDPGRPARDPGWRRPHVLLGAPAGVGRAHPSARRRARLSPALTAISGGVALSGEDEGEGHPIVLLHGLTATRHYVVMGSRALERSGHRVIAYDARGHGRSAAAPGRRYGYEHLAADLGAVLDAAGLERAVLAGASMGAHTALRLALDSPGRVAALALITPSYE